MSVHSYFYPRLVAPAVRRVALGAILVFGFSSSSRGVTVSYSHRAAYYTNTFTAGTAGLYNSGTTNEIGLYAHTNTGQSVGWRTFRTADGLGGSVRELQVGDRFTITMFTYSPNGSVGCALLDGPSQVTTWNDRTNGARAFIQAANNGDLYVTYTNNATTSWSGVKPESQAGGQTFVFDILSGSEITVSLTNQTPKYDLYMLNSPSATQRIDRYSIYLNWDHQGCCDNDAMWHQTSVVQNLGYVEFGVDNGARTIWGQISDGLQADSTSTVSTNNVLKKGTNVVTLAYTNNTHTGYTEIQNGTLQVWGDGTFGTAPSAWVSGKINIWSSGTLQFTNTCTINTNRGLQFGNVDGPTISVDGGQTVTFAGVCEGTGQWSKVGNGTLFLSGNASTNTAKATVKAGTLRIAATGSLGRITGTNPRVNVWSTGTLEFTNTFTLTSQATLEIGDVDGPIFAVQDGSTVTWGGILSGNAAWSKQGPGTFAITAAQTNTGALVVSNGAINIQQASALGTTAGGTTVKSGGALQLQGSITTAAEGLTLNGTGVSSDGALRNISGNNTFAGAVTLGAASRINADAGTLTLNSGTTMGGSGNALTIGGAGAVTISSVIGTGTGTLTKDGTGTGTVSGVNTYSGDTTLSGGKLVATTSASALGSGALTLGTASTTLELDNDSALAFNRNTTVSASMTIGSGRLTSGAGVTHTLGTLGISANTLSIAVGPNVASGTAGVTFGSTTFNATPPVFDVASGANLTLGALQSAGNFTKQGSGTITLNTAAAGARSSGTVTLSGGTMSVGSASALGTTGVSLNQSGSSTLGLAIDSSVNAHNVTVSGNATITSDRATSGAGITHTLGTLSIGANTLSVAKGGNVASGTAGLTFGAVTMTGASVFDVASGALLTFSTTVDNGGNLLTAQGAGNTTASGIISGAGALTKGGAGTLTLSAANTYGGNTTINVGTLKLGAAGVIPDGASKGNVAVSDTLDLNTFSETINGLSGTGNVDTVAGGTPTLTVGANDQTSTFSGVMKNSAGTLAVTKTGTGALTLSGVNTYSGDTTISAGTLKLGAAGVLPDGAGKGNVTVTGTLDLNTFSETINGLSGAGTVDTVAGGTPTLTLGGNNQSSAFSGTITDTAGALALTKTGSGTFTLTGASSYSGATTISAGSMIMNGTNTSSAFTVSSGATNMGVGSVGGLTVSGQVAPGTNTIGIGRLSVTSLTMNNGSSFRCQIGDFSDTTSRDYINNSGGAPTITATVTIYVDSSALSNWNNTQTKSWNIIVGSVSSTNGFSLDESTYWDSGTYPKGTGGFSLSASGGNLVLTYTAPTTPDIAILGTNLATIADGDVTPSTADGTDFGYVDVSGGTSVRTFTITNAGVTSLWFDAISIGGAHASDFTVTTVPNVSTNLLTNAAFAQNGTPASIDTATINGWTHWGASGYYNNDISSQMSVKFWWDDSGIYQDWDCVAGARYDLRVKARHATGDALVNWHGYLKVEFYDSGWVQLAAQELGYIASTSPLDQWIQLSGSYTSPASSVHGRIVLGINNWASGPSGAAYFDDAEVYGRNLIAGSQTTFRVTFDPSGGGMRTGTVYVTNNVSGKTPYDFALQGYGLDLVAPTGARASVDGNEMIRLDWTNSAAYGVIVVHNMSNAPTVLTQGTSYVIGDAVGTDGSRIVGKQLTGTWVEHIVPAGSTNYYTFYSYTNNVYSAGVTVSTNTPRYIPWDIVDVLCYTNAVILTNALNGGQGWSTGWNAWAGFTIVSNDTASRPEFFNMTGYPDRGGNRIKLAAPGGSNTVEAYRNFPMITTGMVFLAARISFQNTGTNRWCGISAVSGTTHKVFFGETWGGNGLLGMADYGGGQTATNVMLGWGAALTNTYLVIAQIDLDSRAIGVVSYPGWASVPAGRPVMSVYDTLAANYMNGINGIGLKAGSDNLACDIGECYFDEIRVTHSWNELLHGTTPALTNFAIGTTNNVYDGQITSGVYTVSATAEDPYGIGANFDFYIVNPSGGRVVTNEHVDTQTWANSGRTSTGTDTNRTGYFQGELGTYTSYWSTVNSNGFWLYDCTALSNGTRTTFTVTDDDTTPPVHSSFTGLGRTLSGATFTNVELASGLVITGLVTDAESGVFGGTSNAYTLFRSGSSVANGNMTAAFANGSAVTSNGQLTVTIAAGTVQTSGAYTMRVISVSYDVDRTNDAQVVTNEFAFTVVDPEIAILGTNFADIVDGDLTPSAADGTDYGAVPLTGGYVDRTFYITNSGNSVLNISGVTTTGTHAADFIVVSFPATVAMATRSNFVVRFDPSVAGLRTAVVHVVNSDTSEADYDFVVQGTNLPDPTTQSAVMDGKELVRLAWTKHASYDVIIVHRATNAPTGPTQGVAYNVGDAIGADGSKVIYKGSGSVLEHVVVVGTTNQYSFYSYSAANLYSPGVGASTSDGVYVTGEIVEPFAYTQAVSFASAPNGGSGFTNAWSVSAGTFTIVTNPGASSVPALPTMASYPAIAGNKVQLNSPGNDNSAAAARSFAPITTGKVYVSAMISYEFQGTQKWAGVGLMSNTTEKVFFGKLWHASNFRSFGLDGVGGQVVSSPEFEMQPYGGSGNTGNVYLILLRYDFATRVLDGKAFARTTSVPATEPGTWDATDTLAAGDLNMVNGVRLTAGAQGAGNNIGNVFYDEIRVANSYGELLRLTTPSVVSTSFVVNAGANVSDAQVTGGTFAVAMQFYDDGGVESTNTSGSFFKPNFDIWNNEGTQILTNEVFSSFTYSGDYLAASDASHAGALEAVVTLGTYTSRWSAINSNSVPITDSTTLSNGVTLTFTVSDDDSAAPLVGLTGTNSLLQDGDFETAGRPPWWTYDGGYCCGADTQLWAAMNGTIGMAWQSWSSNAYGGFGQDVTINPTNGSVFFFNIYGNAESGFTSYTKEGWVKLEFWNGAGKQGEVSNDVYEALCSNRNSWIQFNFGATNVYSGISTVKVIVGYGNNAGTNGSISVKWDDASLWQGSPMKAFIGSTNVSASYGGTNAQIILTDGQLAGVGAANPLKLVFGAYDVGSGLSRGNGGATTQMNIDIGSWVTDNTTNYVATNSSSYAGTFAGGGTSTWAFYGANIDGLIFLTNAIQASLKDADFDRTNDQLTVTNQLYGYLVVNDDDDTPPQVGSGYETNILLNSSFELGNGTTTISNWNRSAGNTEHREGRWSSGYLTDTAIPDGTNILKVFGTAAELVQTNISVVAGAFYHAYGQFYHSSTNDPICQTCGDESLGVFFKVIFYNSSQVPIATNYSGEHNASVPSNVWQYINLYITAPTNAVTATFHVQTSGGTNVDGALYGDDFHLTRDARVMQVWIGTNNYSALSDGGTNGIHTLYDANYAGIASTQKLRLVFGAYDTNSGLDQALMNMDWENWLTDNSTNFVATNSSPAAQTYSPTATSVWEFSAVDFANAFNKTNKIAVSLFDADADRSNDRIIVTNQQYGYIAVLDDDVNAPEATGFVVTGSAGIGTVAVSQVQNGGWSITGLVRDVYSGINVNGSTTSDAQNNISPFFAVYNSTGTAIIAAQIFTNRPADGGATSFTRLAMETVTNTVALGNIPSGTYTVRVTVADNDEDRTNATERAVLSAYDVCTFVVPGAPGMGLGPTTLNLTSYYGSAASGTFTVTNIGSGTLTYTTTNSYTGVGGWLTVASSNGSLATAATQIHTASVAVAGLDACDYQATITVAGNQTNSAQTVVVNLHVIGFRNNETVDAFTNAAGLLSGMNGGNGWTNAWVDDPVNSVTTQTGSVSIPGNYPASSGGKVVLETGNDAASEKQIHRHIPGITAGKIFVAVALRKTRNNNTAGYFGMSMMDGATEKAFFGKRFNEEFFGVEVDSAGYGCSSAFGMYQTTYFIVGMYDFDNDIIKGAVYNAGDSLPLTEAGVNWRCSNSLAASPISRIDAIRLAGKDVESAEFDEIRIAASWEDLLKIGSAEPTLNGSQMTFANVSTGQMDVSWNSGNGIRRMVVAREGAAVTFTPTDYVQYVANTNFSLATSYSGNKIVFDGATNGFTLVGLNPGTNYYLKIFEYNTCGTNIDFLTSGTLVTSNRWTLVPEPANQPTSFAAWQKSSTEISNTWVASAGSPSPSAYLLVYGTNIPSTGPSDGAAYTNGQLLGSNGAVTVIASPGSATTVLNSSLTSCQTYYFRIYPFTTNSGGEQTYNYLTTGAPTSTAATACTDPTIQASNILFSAVDTNKMTISWSNGGGQYRMVVARATNAVDSLPVDQTAYTASAVFGSGDPVGTANFVVYSGTGTTLVVSNLLPGVTYHFRVFEFNGVGNAANYITNTAVGNPASRATAPFGIAYDQFDDLGQGTGQLTDNGRNTGGVGWTNNWSQSFDVQVVNGGNMPTFKCYPRGASSDIISMSNDGNTHEMRRYFGRRTSGRIYAAFLMNIGAGGTNTFAGMSFYNGSGETGYFGKVYSSSSNVLGVSQTAANAKRSDYVFQTGSGNDYLIVGMYDFEADTLYAKAYTTNYFASVDPTTVDQWDAKITNCIIDAIDGVRLAKQDTGLTYFDEVRVGATWEQVMIDNAADPASGPVPTLIYIGPAYTNGAGGAIPVTNLTDADLVNTSSFDFAIRWDDPQGIFLTNSNNQITNFYSSNEGKVIPNWDPLAPGAATNSYGSDNVFTSFYGRNGATSVTTYQYNAFFVTNLDLSQPYFVTVSAQDDPTCVGCTHVAPTGDAVACSRAITVNSPLRFYTTDDDDVPPQAGATPLSILQGGSLATYQDYSGTSNLRRYFLTDGSLTSMGFSASFNIYDTSSGLRRAAGGAVTSMNVSINQFVTNEVGSYASANSSTNTFAASATSVWAFVATNFSYTRVGDMYGSGGTDLQVVVNAPDNDNERTNDLAWSSNMVVGYLRIQDDDVGAPVLSNIGYGGSSASNRAFWISTNNTLVSSAQASGTDTNVQWTIYDGDLANATIGYLKFAFGAADTDSGVGRGTTGSTNSVMSVSVGSIIQGNYTNYSAASSSPDAAGVPLTSVWSFAGAFGDAVITGLMASGSNEVNVTIPDSDNDRTNDQLTLAGARVGWLKVIDDDTNGPVVGANPLTVMSAGNAVDLWTNAGTTNVIWRVSDGEFYSASVANPLQFSFGVYDTSGIRRATTGPSSNMNVDIQRFTTNNTANYAASKSSANTAAAGATSVWEWTSGGDQVLVSNLFGPGSIGLTNVVQATIRDDDNDWVGDNLSLATQQFGYVWLYDDDTSAPVRVDLLGQNLLSNSGFEAVGWWSGVANQWDGTNFPNDELGAVFGNHYRSDFRSHGGTYAVSIPGQWGNNGYDYGGLYQEATNSYGDGVVWKASAWATSDNSWTSNYAAISIEFYQGDHSTRIGASTNIFVPSTNGWQYITVLGTSPVGTAWARIVLAASAMGTNGSLYFDDALMQVATNAALPMDVTIGGTSYYREGTATGGIFQLTDHDLTNVTLNSRLQFVFRVYDPTSGVGRSSTQEYLNYDIGNSGVAPFVNIFNTYNDGLSSPTTTVISATSVFEYVTGFSVGGVHAGTNFVETGDVYRLITAATNPITVSYPNDDQDRGAVDREWVIDSQFGNLVVQDDDNVGPVATIRYIGTNYTPGAVQTNELTDADLIQGGLDFAYEWVDASGLFITNNSGFQTNDGRFGNVSMNWDIVDSNGVQYGTDTMHPATSIFAAAGNGSIYATAVQYNVSVITYTNNKIGTWTIQASGQDMDNDRGMVSYNGQTVNLDRATRADMPMTFRVRDDDSNYPSAANLAINGRYATNVIYDGELSTGFDVRVRFWDDAAGVYVAASNGAFNPPNFDIVNPSNQVVQTNHLFSLSADSQILLNNGGFETASGGSDVAASWSAAVCGGPNNVFARTNDAAHRGLYSLGGVFNTAPYGETAGAWVDVSNVAVGETFIFGGWLRIVNTLPGSGRALVKLDWWDNTNCSGAAQSSSFGTFYTSTTGSWVNIEVASVKPFSSSLWVRVFCEVTAVEQPTNVIVNFDDMYVGSPSNVLAQAAGITVPYSNIFLGDYSFRWSAQDSDNDRTNDTLGYTDSTSMLYGVSSFNVQDDVPGGPTGVNLWINGVDKETTNQNASDQQIRNGQWSMSFRIIDPAGVVTSGVGDEWVPNYSMVNSEGTLVHSNYAFTALTPVGSATNLQADRTMSGINYQDVDLGWYTILFSAQDQDNDRPNDRGAVTNFSGMGEGGTNGNQFWVYDDDTNAPSMITTVAVDVVTWTNVNLFNVTFNAATDDFSGIYQYRYDTNVTASTSATNGDLVSGVATTELALVTSNLDSEVGANGTVVTPYNVTTNGWLHFSADNTTGQFWSAEHHSGTQSIRHVIAAGENGGGTPRYTLIAQQIAIPNTNGYPVRASFSAWFKGDMSQVGNGVTGAAFMKMEFFDANTTLIQTVDNEYGTDHNGNPLFGVNAAAWTNVTITATNGPANARYMRFMLGIAQHDTALAYTGYWDDVAVTVKVIGAVGTAYSFPMTNALEGIRTNWLYAVDDDDDRLGDRLKGPNTNYVTMLDMTPPPRVSGITITNGLDEATEMQLNWSAVANAGNRAGDNQPLSPWRTYYIYYEECTNCNVTTNSPCLSFTNSGYANLRTNTTTQAIISNLNFDSTYRFVVAGQDRAGNLATLSDTVTLSTLNFIVTQGIVAAASRVDISWMSSTNKSYDMLWVDGAGYSDTYSNYWTNLMATVTNSFVSDTGSATRLPPTDVTNGIRFYRVSREGQWATNSVPRRASKEIYLAKPYVLKPGENWISMPMLPDTNRTVVADIFGTNRLPAGSTIATATKMSWYGHTQGVATNSSGVATNVIWLSVSGHWLYSIPASQSGQDANNWLVPTNEAFNIEIPGTATQKMVLVGRLPTNELTSVIYGATSQTNYSVMCYALPYRVAISNLGLKGSGFVGGANVQRSDEIRILDNSAGIGSMTTPKRRIWMNNATNFVFAAPYSGSAESYIVEPGEALIFVRKRGPSITWTNRIYYAPPGKNVNP